MHVANVGCVPRVSPARQSRHTFLLLCREKYAAAAERVAGALFQHHPLQLAHAHLEITGHSTSVTCSC